MANWWQSRIVGHDKIDPAALNANPLNHRLHPKKQRDVVRDSIVELGFIKSVLVNKTTGMIVDGHERVHQAIAAKQDDPSLVIDVEYIELTPAEEAKALAVLDASSELAEVDAEKLEALLNEFETSSDSLNGLLDELAEQSGLDVDRPPIEEDDVPEPPAEPITTFGDLWVLGNHRLLCGDSTSKADVAKLLNQKTPDMVFTDPPYGIDYQDVKKHHRKIENDSSDPTKLIENALALCKCSTAYLCCNWKCMTEMVNAMVNASLPPKSCIVWDKGSRIQNLDKFAKRHEFVLYAGKFGGQKTVADDVWQISREVRNDHPTAKPIKLCQDAIEYTDARSVYDMFAGSGSTLIACEHLNRRCFAMEIDPRYCDVIVARWEALTGQTAVKQSGDE